jgi:alanine racemase
VAQRLSAAPPALEGHRPVWAEVSLDAISHNLRAIRRRVGASRRVVAVVKANAYGHGAIQVARRLEADGIDLLGVAFAEEGLELRRAGVVAPILVMGASTPAQLPEMIASSLIPTVYSASFLDELLSWTHRAATPTVFHLKVDTGMGRLGLLPEELPAALARLATRSGGVELGGVFTTLSCSDDPDNPHTSSQIAVFEETLGRLREAGFTPAFVHAANSGGVIDHPPSWLDTVRPGVMLYGIHPSDRSTRMELQPALSFKARIALIKRVPAGTPLGYGASFICARPSIIGTVPAGYADGVSRSVASRGHVLVRGSAAPYAGRVSMDNFMLDLTDVPGVTGGDEAVIIGRQGTREITVSQFAAWSDTIPYESLCRLGPRVPRIFDKDNASEK